MDKPYPWKMLPGLLSIFLLFLITPIALARQREGNLGQSSSGSFSISLTIMPTVRQYQPKIEHTIDQKSICFGSHGLSVIAKTETVYCSDATFNIELGTTACIKTTHSDIVHTDRIIIEPI